MRTSHKAWAVLGFGIAAYEVWAAPRHETLSEGFDDFVEAHPVASAIGIGAVGFHLMNTFEKYDLEQLDVIKRVGSFLTRKELA